MQRAVVKPRHEDYASAGTRRRNLSRKLCAIAIRHHHIAKQQIESLAAAGLSGFEETSGQRDAVAGSFQDLSYKLPDGIVIINQ